MANPALVKQPWWPEHVATMTSWTRGEKTSRQDIQTWLDHCGTKMSPGTAAACAAFIDADDKMRRDCCVLVAITTHVDGPAGAVLDSV